MKERGIRFGSEGNLVGILAEPDELATPDRPALLLYNVGFGHRVGPHRLNVELARELAARGFVSLRLDLSGLGDSDPRASPGSSLDLGAQDLDDAMAWLSRRRGIDRFALVAMCSGVDVGHAVAKRDPRIVAAAFLDGYAYPTAGYRLRNALGYLRRPRASLHRLLRALRGRAPAGSATTGGGFFDRFYPSQETFRGDVAAMSGRGTRLLYLFSYRWWFFGYRGQFAAMLGIRRLPPGMELEYWTDADHMFTAVSVRRRLVLRLTGWLSSAFPTRGAGVQHESIHHVA